MKNSTEIQDWNFVLPTATKLNPASPDGADYFEEGSTGLLILSKPERSRPTRAIMTYGPVDSYLGVTADIRHDQTNARLGTYTVVGIRRPNGTTEGEIPNRLLSAAVFK